MTLKQLAKKHKDALAAFDRAYRARRRAIVAAQRHHLQVRSQSHDPENPRSRASKKASESHYKLLFSPLIKKNQKI
jgi:hypothetical protein